MASLTIVDHDPVFCEHARRAFDGTGVTVVHGHLTQPRGVHEATGVAMVHAGNERGIVAGGLDHAMLNEFGPPYQQRLLEAIEAQHGGVQPVGTAILIPTYHPVIRRIVHAPCFPHRPRSSYDAMVAILRAVKADDDIRAVVSPGLGHFQGCPHGEEIAEQMAAAWRECGGGTPTPPPRGHTALTYAASQGDEVAVRRLLASKADVTAGDATGATALHWACSEGHLEVADLLTFEVGALTNARTTTNNSAPIHWAAEAAQNSGALVKLLITRDKGPLAEAVDPQNRWKQTPLSQAAAKHADAVRVLLECDADVNNRDFAGYTPLHVAAENGNVETARLLVRAGAPLDARDSVGITPLDVAREHDLTEVAALLEGQDTPPRSLSDSE